jgi:hypothetical protein
VHLCAERGGGRACRRDGIVSNVMTLVADACITCDSPGHGAPISDLAIIDANLYGRPHGTTRRRVPDSGLGCIRGAFVDPLRRRTIAEMT